MILPRNHDFTSEVPIIDKDKTMFSPKANGRVEPKSTSNLTDLSKNPK